MSVAQSSVPVVFSTVCGFCGTGCGLEVTVQNGRVIKVAGDKTAPVNKGETCVKGLQGWRYTQSPQRLTTPLVKENGAFRPATWDEALTRVTNGIRKAKVDYGPEAFACFSSSRSTNELNYLAQKLMRQVIGTNNVDSCNRICHAPSVVSLNAALGSGADTSSYDDFEQTDLIIAWGSNAQEAHPVIWNHMRRGVKNGAKLVVIDPRRMPMSKAANEKLHLAVSTDIALANAMGHVIIEENLHNEAFVRRATEHFDDYVQQVSGYTPEFAETVTGVPAEQIRRVARMYATAPRAMIAWTLGITEHHNGTNNAQSVINLALLTGKVGKPGCGLMPLRGQNNVQGSGDMGALPNKLPGFFDVEDDAARARFEAAYDCHIPQEPGLNLTSMLKGIEHGDIKFVYIIGESPVESDANANSVKEGLEKVDMLVVQELFMTKTAELADVVLPAAGWSEADGTFTNSERGVQRVRKLVDPPGEAREDIFIIQDIANRVGANWNYQRAEDVWNELRTLSPAHFGITYDRLDAEYECSWPTPSLDEPPTRILHTRLHADVVTDKAQFIPVAYESSPEPADDEYPLVLITGRRLAFYNIGWTTNNYGDLVKDQDEYLDMSESDAEAYNLNDGDKVRVSSRRGQVEVAIRKTSKMAPGNLWMSFHFPDKVHTNVLTNDIADRRSGATPFKYTAVKIERL